MGFLLLYANGLFRKAALRGVLIGVSLSSPFGGRIRTGHDGTLQRCVEACKRAFGHLDFSVHELGHSAHVLYHKSLYGNINSYKGHLSGSTDLVYDCSANWSGMKTQSYSLRILRHIDQRRVVLYTKGRAESRSLALLLACL